MLTVHANRREEVEGVGAGNICGAIGLKNTFTGDTIAGVNKAGGSGTASLSRNLSSP